MKISKTLRNVASTLFVAAMLLAAVAKGQTHYAEIDQEAGFEDRFSKILQEVDNPGAAD